MTEAVIVKEVPEFVDQFLNAIGSGKKPWYLQAGEIYSVVKKSAASIPKGKEAFEATLITIESITKYIDDNTNFHVVVDVQTANDLLTQLDSILGQTLVVLDDGFDHFRSTLSQKLRDLIAAILKHKKYVEELASKSVAHVQGAIITNYEKLLAATNAILHTLKTKYPDTFEKLSDSAVLTLNKVQETSKDAVEYVSSTKNFVHAKVYEYADEAKSQVNSTISTATAIIGHGVDRGQGFVDKTAANLLKTAQPYVHDAVHRSQPIVAQAVEIYQPYLNQAKPFIDPLVDRAQGVNLALQENKLIGPYVTKAWTTAAVVLEEAKSYCFVEEQAEVAPVPQK